MKMKMNENDRLHVYEVTTYSNLNAIYVSNLNVFVTKYLFREDLYDNGTRTVYIYYLAAKYL